MMMKSVLSILVLCIVVVSCKSKSETKKDSYVISGTAPGVYNGVRVYLKTVDDQRREIIKDTAIVVDERFSFEGKTEIPEIWFLTINSINGSLPLIIENKDFSIAVNPDNLGGSTISGSESNEALTAYTKRVNELADKRNDLTIANRDLLRSEDNVEKSKVTLQLTKINQELNDYPMTFLNEHKGSYFSLTLLESMIVKPDTDLDVVEKHYNALESTIKASAYGQRVAGQIDSKKMETAKFSALNIGKVAPDFSAPKPDGAMISLNDIKGKATIIDFWAAWCGPCRRENPNVVKVYNKYHDKGLEIIGVSLDRPGQKDRWLKAIEDDQLTWHQVSHLNYFNDPVAQLYNIQAIPATYILDASGTIVAKNLRGDALDAKIAELLD